MDGPVGVREAGAVNNQIGGFMTTVCFLGLFGTLSQNSAVQLPVQALAKGFLRHLEIARRAASVRSAWLYRRTED